MRKKSLLIAICAVFVLTTGCSSSSNQLSDTLSPATESTPTSTEEAAPTDTPVPEPEVLSLGKKASLGDWDIKVKKASIKKTIKDGSYRYFKPSDGNSFLLVSLSVKNNGKTDQSFMPRIAQKSKDIIATLYYQNEYEYSATQLIGYDKDLTTESIKPLNTKNGVIAFEIPKKTIKSTKELTLSFSIGDESITYSLK